MGIDLQSNLGRGAVPDDSIAFFQAFKAESEARWATIQLNPNIYGFQIQQGTRWRSGLNETELERFEAQLGYRFPDPLRNFYRTMNGLDKPAINIYGYDGNPPAYRPVFYSYPDHLGHIHDMIEWVCKEMLVEPKELIAKGISRIFPVYNHRFLLVDIPGHPILSMHGSDIIRYADNLGSLLRVDVLREVRRPKGEDSIPFWLEGE